MVGGRTGWAHVTSSVGAVLLIACGVWAQEPQGEGRGSGQVHVHIFLSKTCPHCELVERDSLEKVSQKLECTIRPHYYDVDVLDEYKRLVILERWMKDTGNDMPVVLVGDHLLGGTKEIEAKLVQLIERYRPEGTPPVTIPTLEEARAAFAATSRPAVGGRGAIRLAYFEQPGCRQCDRVERILKLARARYPTIELKRFDFRTRTDRLLLEALCERARVAPERRLLVPAIFGGERALILQDVMDAALEDLCAGAGAGESRVVWEVSEEELKQAEARLWERSAKLTLVAVAAGGLVDGINPCAFATLVFLVCCLTGVQKSRKMILLVGGAFTAGVFIAYFCTGVGLNEALLRLEVLPVISSIVTWTLIVVVFTLAGLSLWDFVTALRGRAREMTLKLPHKLRMRINALIARGVRARSLVPAALGLGVTVSLMEFVCTGQIYLPLIRHMTTVSASRVRALFLLTIYNLAFVLPLVLIFLAVYFGLSSQRLLATFQRHVSTSKLLLAIFFLALGALMLYTEVRPIP